MGYCDMLSYIPCCFSNRWYGHADPASSGAVQFIGPVCTPPSSRTTTSSSKEVTLETTLQSPSNITAFGSASISDMTYDYFLPIHVDCVPATVLNTSVALNVSTARVFLFPLSRDLSSESLVLPNVLQLFQNNRAMKLRTGLSQIRMS